MQMCLLSQQAIAFSHSASHALLALQTVGETLIPEEDTKNSPFSVLHFSHNLVLYHNVQAEYIMPASTSPSTPRADAVDRRA